MHVIRSRRAWKAADTESQAASQNWPAIARTIGQIIVLGVLGGLCGLVGGMVILKAMAYYS
ncbi:MAG: hypothetical protein HC926_02275 [Synechococcaceae cyanobacterium SM2_3_60]|nr:hypothetical protein [Synechococcaceae cyanobacterium SM2_3_60]